MIKKPDLTLIRGGKADTRPFIQLAFPDKISRLRQSPAKKRLELILGDAEPERLAQALQAQEIYWTVKEIGITDALALLEFASPEQREFFLDMELWERDAFSREKGLEWLGYLLETGEEKVAEQLRHLDLELLILLLIKEIAVGGGVGGEIAALHVRELELGAHVLREPARNLHAPDVVPDGVVRARLGDEDAVAVP